MVPTILAPAIEIDLGGRTRKLRMDLGAMALVDEQTGINLINDISALQHPTPRMLGVLAWACLVADDPSLEDPQIGIKQVTSWIDFSNVIDVITKLTQAFQVATPEPGSAPTNGSVPKNQRRGSAG